MDREGAKTEADIIKRTGAKLNPDAFEKLFEGKRARAGREAIERMRAGRAQAAANINASMDKAYARQIDREMKASKTDRGHATEAVARQMLADRMHLPLSGRRGDAAVKMAGKAADAVAAGADALMDAIERLRNVGKQAGPAREAKAGKSAEHAGEALDAVAKALSPTTDAHDEIDPETHGPGPSAPDFEM